MPTVAPIVKLSNGQEIPILGLGTWRSYEFDAEQAVKDAIDIGYRLIDTAFVYENEFEVGNAIRSKINDGVIKREDVFVVTKLRGIYNDSKLVENACRKSLSNLGLKYFDLYIMHFPKRRVHALLQDSDYLDTWHAMEQLVDQGLVRGLGLSNFSPGRIELILKSCRIKPLVNQVECHPSYNQRPFIEFSRERGILLMSYCLLAPSSAIWQFPPYICDKKIRLMAQKYGKTTAQICLRYLIQLGTIPIPKSVSKKRIAENFDVFDFQLSAEDMGIMDKYDKAAPMNVYRMVPVGVMTPPDC